MILFLFLFMLLMIFCSFRNFSDYVKKPTYLPLSLLIQHLFIHINFALDDVSISSFRSYSYSLWNTIVSSSIFSSSLLVSFLSFAFFCSLYISFLECDFWPCWILDCRLFFNWAKLVLPNPKKIDSKQMNIVKYKIL